MKHFLMFVSLLGVFCTSAYGQGAKNIKINEIMTNNTESLLDEYGNRLPWIELANTSFSTYDIRGMYITTNKKTTDKSLSVPERVKLMSQIPNGSERTTLSAQEHILFFLNSQPAKGDWHLDTKVNPEEVLWIALFDGNGVDLIDSVTVPVLQPNYGYARTLDKKTKEVAWNLKQPEFVTPGTANISSPSESKIAKLKREDPYGVGITVLAMGVVFFCLALLYVSFYLLGKFMTRSKYIKKVVDMDSPENRKLVLNISKEEEQAGGSGMLTPDAIASMVEAKPEMTDEIAAVIAQAIKDYQDDVHVEESGVITLIPKTTPWSRR